MSFKVEQLEEKNMVKLVIEASAEEFEAGLNAAYNKNKNKISVPGFRKGKAPRKIIETNYGKGVFYNDAIDIVFPEVYPAAIDELKIEPIEVPSIDVEEISKDNGLVLLVDVEVKPEFQLGEYKGVEVEKVEETVNEDVVNAKLEEMAKNYGKKVEEINDNENLKDYIKEGIESEKAIDFIVKNAKIK